MEFRFETSVENALEIARRLVTIFHYRLKLTLSTPEYPSEEGFVDVEIFASMSTVEATRTVAKLLEGLHIT